MKNFQENEHSCSTRKNKAWMGAIALAVTASLISSCTGLTQNDRPGQGTVTSDDVTQVEEGDQVIGELVTIRSGVSETLDANGFVMESNNGDSILIINSTGTPFMPPAQDIPIQVTGQLEMFNATELTQQYGMNLESALYEEYEQEPVIIAQNFALAPRPQDLWNAPDEYFDEIIAVEGDLRPLEEADNAFALFEDGWVSDTGVLVVGVNELVDKASLEAGENIVVTGQARRIDESFLQEAGFDWNDEQIQEFLSRYENRPVIEAEQVYPSAVPPHPSV
ncbi:MAG: hypothetical protein KME20_11790 [Kaiparowitsia implicata GSE-PSE-MK54-09C]|jgi:hypothetical protein|nr:hypothetical protein [Kaiparowitsia implicata GSE-PSE-MK54-09C]